MPQVKEPGDIGSFDIEPITGVGEYNISKQQDAYHHKAPNWDSTGESANHLMIRNKREHEEMLRLQKEMEGVKIIQQNANVNRFRKICQDQKYLRQRFVEINSFAKDCEDKQALAQKKVNEEIAQHSELHKKIKEAQEIVATMTAFRETLKATSDKYLHYEETLQNVVDKCHIFESIEDCTSRCDALMIAQIDILNMDNSKLAEIKDMQKRMIEVTNQATLTVLGLKNEIAVLNRSYIRAKDECLKWEKILAKAKSTTMHNTITKDQSADGINHIYRMLCRRRNIDTKFHRDNIEAQLDFIKKEVGILNAVVEQYNNMDDAERAKMFQKKRMNFV